jgi:hypothetical protein
MFLETAPYHTTLTCWKFPPGTHFDLTVADLLALGEATLRQHPELSPVAEEYVRLIGTFQDSINYALLHQLFRDHFPVGHHHFECGSWYRPEMESCENTSAVSTLANGLSVLKSGMQPGPSDMKKSSHADLIKFLSACLHLLFNARERRLPESSGILEEYTDFIKDISTMDWRVNGELLTEARIVIVREVQFTHLVGRQSDPDWRVVLPLLGDKTWKNKDDFWATD